MANKSKSLSFPLRNSREVDARPSFKLTCKRKVHKSIDHVLPVLVFWQFSHWFQNMDIDFGLIQQKHSIFTQIH